MQVELIIDGKSIKVDSNTTILEAARELKIEIPTLCYLKNINEPASCRVCVVEVEGARNLVTACSTKVREGMVVGAKVTLRANRMYEFFDKLVSIALPRVRDFRGVPTKSFDGRGNYALGVKEQLIFPEISYDQVEKVRGFDICFTTTAKTDEEAYELLKALGMPFAAK